MFPGMLGNDLFINNLLPHNVVYNYDILLIIVVICSIVRNILQFFTLPTLFHDILNSSQNYTFHSQLISIHAMKAYRGIEILLRSLLSWALYGGEKSNSRPARLVYRSDIWYQFKPQRKK